MGAGGEEYDYLFRVVLVGDSGVGKTNLLLRFTKNEFNRDSHSTIGVDFMSKSFTIDQKKVKAIIWDTAGQDRFRSIATSFYRGSSAALLVYDITNELSFQNVSRWLEDVKKYGDVNMVFCLVGNKCDLESSRKVSVDAGKQYANVYFVYSRFKKEPEPPAPKLIMPLSQVNSVKIDEDGARKRRTCCSS